MVPPASSKLHICWICRVSNSHGDDDAGVRRWFGGSLRRTASLNVLIFRSSVQSPHYGESGTSQINLSLSFWNTNLTVPSGAESPVISACVGVLKELSCDWPKEPMESCLLSTHQLFILSKLPTYTAEFWLESGTRVIITLLHSLNYRVGKKKTTTKVASTKQESVEKKSDSITIFLYCWFGGYCLNCPRQTQASTKSSLASCYVFYYIFSLPC